MVKDKIALGTLVGTTATIPQLIINFFMVQLHFSNFYDFQISGGIYLYKNLTYTFWGIVFGGLVWEFMAAGLGILVVYFVFITGKDYWWLKGLVISNAVMFIFVYGLFYTLAAPRIVPWDLGTNWSVFLENLIFGLTAGYLTIRWGNFDHL